MDKIEILLTNGYTVILEEDEVIIQKKSCFGDMIDTIFSSLEFSELDLSDILLKINKHIDSFYQRRFENIQKLIFSSSVNINNKIGGE